MKLMNSFGPNPRMVRMFLIEKGIELPTVEHDILANENRQAPYLAKNPSGQLPALELDDGSYIAETVAICEYLDEVKGGTSLVGDNAEDRARGRQLQRQIEFIITEDRYNGFRYSAGLDLFKNRVHCMPEAVEGLKIRGDKGLKWLDGVIAGREFVCGSKLRLADLALYCCLDFTAGLGQPLDESNKNIMAWFKRMEARPSAAASLYPGWDQVGMRG